MPEARVTAPQSPEAGGARVSGERALPGTDSHARVSHSPVHRWGFGAFFLAQSVFVLVSAFVAGIFGSSDRSPGQVGPALITMLTVPTVVAGLVAVVITLVRGNGPRLDFGLRWRWSDVVTGLKVGGLGLVVTTLASMVWARWAGDEAQSAVSGMLEGVRLSPVLAVLIFFHVWLVAPFCEELVYRGLLWGAMERLKWSPLTAFVLSTAAFAIGHWEPSRTVLLLVIAIPIGLARFLTGRLTASVVAHQVNNFLPALGLLLMSLGVLPA